MTSKIIVNNIESDSGISSITFNDDILVGDINSTGTSTFNVISGVSTIGVNTVHVTSINNLNHPTVGPLSNRNLIINGAMKVAQRSTSSTSLGYTVVDRFRTGLGGSGAVTCSQSTDSPLGFSKSFKIDVDTADTLSAGEEFYFEQRIEAQNCQHFNYGTSSAQSVTLSFWVKSYQTGQYSAWFYQPDSNRDIFFEYTVRTSGTWEYKTITIPGDSSGVINDDDGTGFQVRFYLGAGPDRIGTVPTNWGPHGSADRVTSNQIQVINNTSNYWQITGVQLETGSVATPFEHRSYADELFRCQRYYQEIIAGRVNTAAYGICDAAGQVLVNFPLAAEPRVNVAHDGGGTLTKVGNITVNLYPSSSSDNITGIAYYSNLGSLLAMGLTTSASVTVGDSELVRYGSSGGQKIFTLDVEL